VAKAIAGEVINELRLTEDEFDWGGADGQSLNSRVVAGIARASRKTKLVVGSANYASTDTDIAGNLKDAEHALACAYLLRQRGVILSSRPEEAPPPEYVDLNVLQEEVERYERDWNELTGPYKTEDLDKPGTGFSFGSVAIDETEEDDYEAVDYGTL
jgi:hypothetical protein